MKALAIDSAVTKFTVAVKNDGHTVSCTYDVGMRQSELLLPAVDYVLKTAGLAPCDLDFTAVCAGPGSFTGLRLSFALLKALQLSVRCPVYAVPTLDAYAYHYRKLPFAVLCAVDAKKDRFYAKIIKNGQTLVADGDYTPSELLDKIAAEPELLICGSDSRLLYERMEGALQKRNVHLMPFTADTSAALFELALEQQQSSVAPLYDYDGPIYIRPSEAEEKIAK